MELTTKILVISITACFLITLGGVLKPIVEAIFPPFLATQLEISENSFVYEFWLDVPLPVYMEFYYMTIGNPSEFLQGKPPYMVQKGPYVYREYRPKVNVSFNANHTVTYLNNKIYVFDEELSIGPDTEKFTTLNLPVFSVAYWLKSVPDGIQDIWELIHALSGAEPLIELSISDLMWGYEDDYLKLAQEILGEDLVASTEFGLFLNVNDTDDGVWTVFTGVDDINKVSLIDKYNGESYLPYWATSYANMINGTDGTQQHPYVKKHEKLYNFLPVACRSGYTTFETESRVAGTPTYLFVAPPDMVAAPDENPDNIGFCVPDNSSCPPKGLIDGSSCYFNAPVYLSMPHFLYGDESLLEMAHGLTPNKEEHQIMLQLDPLSGITFQGHLRAMMSLKVEPYDYISGTEFIKEAYVPVVWFNESSTITEEYAKLHQKYVNLATYGTAALMSVCIFGGVGMLLGVAISLYRNKKLSDEQLPFNHQHHGDLLDKTPSGNDIVETQLGSGNNKAYVPEDNIIYQ